MYKNFTKPLCRLLGYKEKSLRMLTLVNLQDVKRPRKGLNLILAMKLIAVLLLTGMVHVSAATLAQKITINRKHVRIENVLEEIGKQSGYNFFLDVKALKNTKPISINVNNVSIEEVLNQILKGQPLAFTIEDKIVVIKEKEVSFLDRLVSHFNDIDVRGTIQDQNGKALRGATVTIKGTKRYISTDEEGKFSLTGVDEKAILVISFVGYKTKEIPASSVKGQLTISLELTTSNLKEVEVTTAYGIVRSKKELGYSVAKVTGEEINKANSGNILNGLVGKVSGLNIMTQSSEMSPKMRVLLRGIRSFGQSSNNQPLFVFNGAPLSFGSDGESAERAIEFINNLNPADIEDVTVLKGANGTAMYGPEGVNGVILITTKKIKQGELAVNARVNSSYTRMDFRQRTDQRTFGVGDDVSFFGGKSAESWGPAYDGRIISIGYPDKNGEFQKVPYKDLDDRYNFFNVARSTRTNVSLAQGDATSSFYLGLGHVDQTGLLPGDKQNQTTVLFNSTKKLGKNADFQVNINYSKMASDRGGDVTNKVLNTPSFIPLLSYKDYKNSYWGGLDNYWSGTNPYASLDLSRQKTTDNTFTGSFIANVKVLPWLSVKDQVSLNYWGRNQKKNAAPVVFSDFARVDPFKAHDAEPKTEDYLGTTLGFNNDLLLTAIHKTGDFLIRANLGNTIRDNFEKQLKTNATLVIPVYNNIFSRSDFGIGSDEVTRQTRSISLLGNVSLGYKDKIFLELTGRNEWDSKRAKIARGKDFYFGANTSLVLKEIVPLLKEQAWLSNFRLRLSATHTANMNIEPNQSERILNLTFPYPFTNPSTGKSLLGYGILTNPNPNIKPEKVFSQEYGLEMGFLENRIRFDGAYYNQVNNGVIMQVGVPSWSGYPDLDNAGRFRNTGWEFDLGLNPLVEFGEDINISLSGRFSINKNKVLEVSDIYNGTFIARDPSGNAFYARVGHSAFEFPVTDFKRDPEGRVIVDKSTGMPTVDYQNPKIMGKTLPVYQGGVTLNFTYKRFSLSTQADYSAGNDHGFGSSTIIQGTSALTLLNNREVFVFPNSVIEDSPGHFVKNTNVAVSNAGKELFSKFADATVHSISSANYWKIREIALQYEMPIKSKLVKRMAGSIYARDLFSFYPHSNIYGDPVSSNGPGLKTNQNQAIGQRQPSQSNNVSGSAADTNVTPGTIIYGFTFGLSF
ncbi:SusC/RagA family TonB-linked outer membrane protein [Pedobacter hiemivivus]|uniref:SusC/RagA family TonB-linked outer membrane protein n=2 Tax=Pedobacter hiemivivus TaxID=2530454 RepID=A0A4U1G6T4_9SPHI|nr:SusC/RagA family TonB-linked outer membrane protein [Pedobacter hiemivivus]